MKSAAHLAQHLQEVPVLVIPCIEGRYENAPPLWQAIAWASILPATWSFMLAARARGLGTAWTTLHRSQVKKLVTNSIRQHTASSQKRAWAC